MLYVTKELLFPNISCSFYNIALCVDHVCVDPLCVYLLCLCVLILLLIPFVFIPCGLISCVFINCVLISYVFCFACRDTISLCFKDNYRGAILTTHYMDEADALCSNIAIMVNGQMK